MNIPRQVMSELMRGWRPIAWVKDFETFRGAITMKPNGECVWRVQPFDGKFETVSGEASSLDIALEALTRAATALNVAAPSPG
jgi:hypothetical protein